MFPPGHHLSAGWTSCLEILERTCLQAHLVGRDQLLEGVRLKSSGVALTAGGHLLSFAHHCLTVWSCCDMVRELFVFKCLEGCDRFTDNRKDDCQRQQLNERGV